MKLIVDIREKKLIKLLEAFKNQFDFKKIDIEIKNLPLGDAIIVDDNGNEKIIVERKSLNDLASSIKDGRYIEQSHRLNGCEIHNHNIIYIIEGNLSPLIKTSSSSEYFVKSQLVRTDPEEFLNASDISSLRIRDLYQFTFLLC